MKRTIKQLRFTAIGIIVFLASSIMLNGQISKFSLSFNSLTTNFNYGKSNGTLQPYKKNYRGLQIGASYQAGITKYFSVVPELYFAMKGGILTENNPETINKSTLRLFSIESPVLARFHYKNFYINAGPYASYSFAGNIKMDGSNGSSSKLSSISFGNAASDFKHWDLGAQIGAGYNFPLKKAALGLDVRYGYGLVNISRSTERYNRMLNISLVLSKIKLKNK